MAIIKDNIASGPLGKTKLSNTKNGQILSLLPVEVRQTENSEKSATTFGLASTIAKEIRFTMSPIIDKFCDPDMVNRLKSVVQAILFHFKDKETETFRFRADSFKLLCNFNFHAGSLWQHYLWVNPGISFSDGVLTVTIPDLLSPSDIRFPEDTDNCQISIKVDYYALHAGYRHGNPVEEFEFDLTDDLIPGKSWTFDVPDGCLCLVGIGLIFSKRKRYMRTSTQGKDFNPSGICGAVVSSGTFVLPEEADKFSAQVKWAPMGVELLAI
jgi:hypothetical protein